MLGDSMSVEIYKADINSSMKQKKQCNFCSLIITVYKTPNMI